MRKLGRLDVRIGWWLWGMTVVALGLLPVSLCADDDPHMTGLRIPHSPESVSWEKENMVVPRRIRLNALGLQRVNQARSFRGQTALAVQAAEIGHEVYDTVKLGEWLTRPGAPVSATAPLGFPVGVDNSALAFFPPIRSQGAIGSCAQFSAIYYCLTHMTAMKRGWDAKNGGDAFRLSPKFTYNMLNFGESLIGSDTTAGWMLAFKHGVATWAEWPYDSDFRAWPLSAAIWRNALNHRADQIGMIVDINTQIGLDQLKTMLTNGYVLELDTYINSWQFKAAGNDPATTDDDAISGKNVCYWLNGAQGAHAITIVGYNDSVWVDINSNGTVDAGEKGALRIANSWGTGWMEGGFTWLAYDALKPVSAVAGGPNIGRSGAGDHAAWVTARSSYTPKVLAEFTLNHQKRNHLAVSLGHSDPSLTDPTVSWEPAWVLTNAGGAYGFDGSQNAVDGSFVLDFTDILPALGQRKRWYLKMKDSATGAPATLKSFTWRNLSTGAQATLASVPLTFDAQLVQPWVEIAYTNGSNDTTPPTVSFVTPTNGSAVSGQVGLLATATDNVGVSVVEFLVDGVPKFESVTPPYGANWDTTRETAGGHTLTARAFDQAGNQAVHTISVNTPAQRDQTPPIVYFTTPLDQAPLSGTVVVDGTATDNVGVTSLILKIGTIKVNTPNPFPYTWNTAGTPWQPGPYTVRITARDQEGNESEAKMDVVIAGGSDTDLPWINMLSPTAGANVSGSVLLQADGGDNRGTVASVEFLIDNVSQITDTSAPFTCLWNTTGLPAGSLHTLTVVARDPSGNSGTQSRQVTVVAAAESVAPTVALTSPGNGTTQTGVIYASATASDTSGIAKVEFLVDGITAGIDTVNPYGISWNTTLLAAGNHTLSARAYDFVGNTAITTHNITLVDTTPPAVTLTSPFNGSAVSGQVTLSAVASDNTAVASVEYLVDGVSKFTMTTSPFTGLWDSSLESSGSHTITIKARDLAGNIAVRSVNVTTPDQADRTPPTVAFIYPANGATVTGIVQVDVAASDNVGIVQFDLYVDSVKVDLGRPMVFPYAWDTTLLAPGPHTLWVDAFDAAGNVSRATRSVSVGNETSPPPDVGLVCFPNPATHGAAPVLRITIDGNGDDVTSFEITIFDRTGRVVHSTSVQPLPAFQGNGRTSYEYPWTGDIPSGRYRAVILLRRGSDTIQEQSSVTVIR